MRNPRMPRRLIERYCAICGTELTPSDIENLSESDNRHYPCGILCAECQEMWNDYRRNYTKNDSDEEA